MPPGLHRLFSLLQISQSLLQPVSRSIRHNPQDFVQAI
jgi:hypothetical protein